MSVNVKNGLGLLVVAVIALVIGNVAMTNDSTAASLLVAVAGIAMFVSVGVGLVLIAWGLLRD